MTAFFDNIDRELLIKKLIEKGVEDRFIYLVQQIITQATLPETVVPEKGIPQGLPVSNVLAQIYLDDLKENLHQAIPTNFEMIRYVDDVVVLFNDRAYSRISRAVISMLKNKYGININKSKTVYGRIDGATINFLGYRFKVQKREDKKRNVSVSVREDTSQKMRTKLTNIIVRNQKSGLDFENYRHRLVFQLNTAISGLVLIGSGQKKKYGWIFFYSQINDMSIFYILDKFMTKQLRKRFSENQYEFLIKAIPGFVKSYYEMKKNKSESKYAVHPDSFTQDEKKGFLRDVARINDIPVADNEINQKFKRELYKVTKSLEEDTEIEIS